jgi:DNA-binding transcriptional regulator YbjK
MSRASVPAKPSTPRSPPQKRTTSVKGERSRQAIINATLVCIAKHGLNSVTHRAIAKEAGVPHSLTTYFFSSLNELIAVAFERYVNASSADSLAILDEISKYLDTLDPATHARAENRHQVLEHLTAMLAGFVLHGAVEPSLGVAVELNVLYTYRDGGTLRYMAMAHREKLVAEIAEIVLKLAPERINDAFIDASLLLSLLHKLQLDCINLPEAPPRDLITREIGRLLTLMFAGNEREPALPVA